MLKKVQSIDRKVNLFEFPTIKAKYIYSLNKPSKTENKYNVCICEEKDGKIVAEFNKIITCDSETAKFVVQLLYNNCVAPIHLCDIIDDLGLK